MRIVIGQGNNKNVEKAISKFKSLNYDLPNIDIVYNDDDLLKAIKSSDVNAVIRGSLAASSLISNLRKSYSKNLNRATFISYKNHEFLLAPVGIDEGRTIEEKTIIIDEACQFLEKIAKTPKIAVLSSGRKGDRGRSKEIDKSLDESGFLTDQFKDKYGIKNYNILIEEAIEDKNNLLICPDGIIGNYLFRTLVLVCGWHSLGAVTLGIDDIFIDTSRSQTVDGYLRSIDLAIYLANLRK